MTKAMRRSKRKGASRGRPPMARMNANTAHVGQTDTTSTTAGTARAATANRPFFSPSVRGPQSLIFPGMVMLGCWLMAFTFFFLSTEQNHLLFGVMAGLMALLWTFSFGVRARKLLGRTRT